MQSNLQATRQASTVVGDPEEARLNALYELNLLDTAPSEGFDRITRMASQLFNVPIAAVSLTDRDRQWFKSRVGVDHWQIPREKAPCRQVAHTSELLVIPDLTKDECYLDSHLAHSGVRFYAGAPLITRDGHALGAMCVLSSEPRTVTDQEMAALKDLAAIVMNQIELQHAFGRIDPVSGLPNRNQFIDDIEDLARENPKEPRLAVIIDLLDLSQHTAALNAIGPSFTDDLMRAGSQRLRCLVSPTTSIYQIGPTHLGYLMPSVDDRKLVAEAVRIREEMSAASSGQGTPLIIRAVLGIAPFELGETSPQDLLREAHSAARDARNTEAVFGIYSASRGEVHRRRFQLLADFPGALDAADQLSVVFQPRMDQRSGVCVAAEALLRWHHPTLGGISPAEFVPLIEQTALSREMTEWVLTATLKQLAILQREDNDLILSINISAANLHEEDFASRVIALAHQYNIPPNNLELELTESAIIRNGDSAIMRLNELRAAGFHIAIDDFGTGYSSFSYLERIPADVVKIDRSFIQDMGTSDRSAAVVATMISLIHNLGYRVVAEGVETQQTYDTLRGLGCDEAQGYLIARPLPPEEFQVWVKHTECSSHPTAL